MSAPEAGAFDLQPTLRGSRITLRPLTPRDFESLFAVASDPLVWEQHPESTRYKREVFEVFFAGALESRGAFLVLDTGTSEVMGSSRYYNLKPERVSVGFTFLARKYWGGSFNGELKSLMLGHAFRFVPEVDFEVGENNRRSRRAVEKLGARYVGVEQMPTYRRVTYRIDAKIFERSGLSRLHVSKDKEHRTE